MVILITGITSGFGRAMAERLSSDGHRVYGTHRSASEFIPSVTYIKADACVEDEVRSAVDFVMEKEGRIDVFINNAGMGIGGPLEFCSLEDATRQMDVNWMGMVRFLHYVLPVMRRQRSGKIICMSSIGGVVGLPFQGLYCASKFAIEGYCEALRMEVRGFGIDVVVIRPGDFSTNFTSSRKSVSNPEAMSAYSSYATSLESIEHDELGGLKPDCLAARISKIVMKRHPAHSYVISTFEQYLSTLLKRILPSKLFINLIAGYYKV